MSCLRFKDYEVDESSFTGCWLQLRFIFDSFSAIFTRQVWLAEVNFGLCEVFDPVPVFSAAIYKGNLLAKPLFLVWATFQRILVACFGRGLTQLRFSLN